MDKQVSDLLKTDLRLSPVDTGLKTSGKILVDIDAVIFDIYGTLLVSGSGDVGTAIEAGSPAAFKAAFKKAAGIVLNDQAAESVKNLFFTGIEREHARLKSSGIPYPEVDITEIWTAVLTDALPGICPAPAADLSPELIAAAYESTVNPVAPMPGAARLLSMLRSSGMMLGIISNAQFYTPVIFRHIFGDDFEGLGFSADLCFFSYIERRAKPDTLLFEKLTERLSDRGIPPSRAVFVGNDMLKDIMPAAATGYKTALFAGDRRSLRLRSDHDACRNIKPDVILKSLLDLTVFIQDGQHEKTF